ncbi:MAG: IclR family transcriptional regulator [Rhizobiaceae bacterium]|nr:IclR family transcriptional regulator [Rhizobiaceae bacterium]
MDKTLLKGLAMIEALANSRNPRGVSDLAEEMDLTKSNVHRVLKTLESAGYVAQLPATGRYKLSLKLWELGSKLISRLELKREALDVMERLSDSSRETVHLSILDGAEVIYIDKIDSPEPIRAYSTIGGRAPAYAVATGKALLAFRQPDPVGQLEIVPFTPNTVRNAKELSTELGRIRAQGYAINTGEWRDGVSGVAAPIYGPDGVVEAAIGISGPTIRFKPKRVKLLVEEVVAAAATISSRLGHRASL